MQNFGIYSFLALLIFALELPLGQFAHAETIFRWEDDSGKVSYGTKPPINALKVKEVEDKSFSKYSGVKVLNALNRANRKNFSLESVEESIPQHPTASLDPSSEGNAMKPNSNKTINPIDAHYNNDLAQENLLVEHNTKNQVILCQVIIKNNAGRPRYNVSVAFQFKDGTLVPGEGPEIILPGHAEKFSVPPQFLPITVIDGEQKRAAAVDAPDPSEKSAMKHAVKPIPIAIVDSSATK